MGCSKRTHDYTFANPTWGLYAQVGSASKVPQLQCTCITTLRASTFQVLVNAVGLSAKGGQKKCIGKRSVGHIHVHVYDHH